jgi:phosphate transport system protein
MNDMTDGHTVQSFNDEMNHLHDQVLRIAGMAREQLRRAMKTLEDEDSDAARDVVKNDDMLNQLDVEIDEDIVRLIAKRQPMARDLREIITVGKIVTDIERVGDEARKIALLTINFYDNHNSAPNYNVIRDINKMGEYVDGMLERAVRAFDELDIDLALEVIAQDRELDNEFKSALRRLSTFIMEDSRLIGHSVEIVLGLRALERIGGHAKNIGGYVVFLVKGMDVRHKSLETVVAELKASGR